VIGQIHLFVKVVETGGFTSASRELAVPKSTVSRQIARLEDRLGVRLIERTTRAFRTTEAGQTYYERCAQVVADLQEAEAAVTQAQVAPRGVLRVSAPLTFGYLFMGRLVAQFMEQFTEVQLEVDLTDRKVDLIEEGYHVAVRVGQLRDSSMIARRLGSSEHVIAASPAYLAARGTPKVPDDLREHECMLYGYRNTAGWRLSADVSVPVRGRLTSNNGDLLRAAAVGDQGIVFAPRFILGPDLKSGRLVLLLEEFTQSDGGIWAMYPHSRNLSVKVRAFVDFASEYFAGVPPWE